ncbi:hypothetical protein ACFR9U_03935 [Halorientalis brevis]|uniref:HVO-0234-like beta-propeller domain-containing protein n=1 Tax=Halorientalis brevis TaxID=1126241 RepID=A0ABD6C9F4_9EURY|nr:hypothetical protein [Halorientalis brevis]
MSDEDISIDEKRVYAAKSGVTELYVATGLGLAVVSVSDDIVGEFSLVRRCTATDVATDADRLVVATDEDVLVADRTDQTFRETGFGPASAVALTDGALLAGDDDGRVARYDDGEWTELGTVGEVRAIDGDLVAASDGAFRLDDDGLSHVGLDDVRDVTTSGTPVAATGDGLYYLGPGWAKARDGDFTTVDRDESQAHAATVDALYEQVDGEWTEREVPRDGPVVALAHGPGTYALTENGTVLVDVGDGWRDRALGLRDVAGLAVAP